MLILVFSCLQLADNSKNNPSNSPFPSFAMQIWLGGTPNQMSLAKTFMDKVKIQDLEKVLEPLFYHWKRKRQSKESFGDFTWRLVSFRVFFV